MTSPTCAVLIFGLLISFAGSSLAGVEPECRELQDKPPDQLLAYLARHEATDRAQPFCTEYALRTLGGNAVVEAIPVLLSYLTFKRELNELEKFGAVLRPGSDLYPAVDGLMGYGSGSGAPPRTIADSLIRFLAMPRSELQVDNALTVFQFYYREKPEDGVRRLATESRKHESIEGSRRLRTAAETLARKCGKAARDSCLQVFADYFQ